MGLEIKNRQKQTADLCKQHLRQKYPDKLGVGGRVYRRFEGPPKNSDLTRWGEFTDIKDIKKEMFRRLENQSSINGWTPWHPNCANRYNSTSQEFRTSGSILRENERENHILSKKCELFMLPAMLLMIV